MRTFKRVSGLAAALLSAVFASATFGEPSRTNILELASGGVVMSASSSYGGSWEASNLVDGSTRTGWCSAQGAALPHFVVIELPQPYAVSAVAVDATDDQEGGYPGISAKTVEVYGSSTSASAGFNRLATVTVPKAARGETPLAKPAAVQWLKFVVTANWGNEEYTEIMELEAYGAPVGAPPKVDVAGLYQTNYGPMRLEQAGAQVWGCYYEGDGQIEGNLTGRVLQGEWRQNEGKRVGGLVMVLSSAGDALNGAWYENGRLAGEWSGQKADVQVDCTVARRGGLAQRLAAAGHVALYGIYFESGSATIKPESRATLDEVLAALKAEPSLKLLVGGHTDSTNTDAYNMQLSQRRAEAVVAWLTANGVEAARLKATGFGKSQPVADNATAAGRALNRRVEVSALK